MNTPSTPQPLSTEALKEHQRNICEGLIKGKQGQIRTHFDVPEKWTDHDAHLCLALLFSADHLDYLRIRIKPIQRKVWVGWKLDGPTIAYTEDAKARMTEARQITNWIEVVEPLP